MSDKLRMDAINALPHPLVARFCGGDLWPVHDIDVETGLMRIDVCGLLQVKHFADVMQLQDGDGHKHDADQYWLDEPCASHEYLYEDGSGYICRFCGGCDMPEDVPKKPPSSKAPSSCWRS